MSDAITKRMISLNNHNIKISFPARVINIDELKDGFVDVQPVVNYINPLTGESSEYDPIYHVRVLFPSTATTSICFPLNQGDLVDLVFQSVNIEKFVDGNVETHDPKMFSLGNMSDVVAHVGFETYQQSCMNPNNYKNEFNNQDLNIVHNKNTGNEVIMSFTTDGKMKVVSPSEVIIDAPTVDATSAIVKTNGDVEIKGMSVYQHMTKHTHPYTDDGSPMTTGTPNPL